MTFNVEAALAELSDYADQLAESGAVADRDSLARARTARRLYESMQWVEDAEFNAAHPIKEPKGRGRREDPRGRNRFSKWLRWRQERAERRALQGPHVYRLINAAEAANSLPTGNQITSERTIRPLDWLRKNGYLDRALEVWKRAVELAGSEDEVTGEHVRKALADWKRDVLGIKGRSLPPSERARSKRIKAQVAVEEVWQLDEAEARRFYDWFAEFLRAQQGEAT